MASYGERIPKKIECLSSREGTIEEIDKTAVIEELRQKYSLTALLKVASIPRSNYYYYQKKRKTPDKYERVKVAIKEIFHNHQGRYGYRRVTMELRNKGYKINHKAVQRLMTELGLKSKVRPKKYRSYEGEVGKIAPNLINRDFQAARPNEKWTTDVTEFALCGEKVYLSPVLDMYNGEIIDYSVSSSPNLKMVLSMLNKAFRRLPKDHDLTLHSDQGKLYQHKRYQRQLEKHGIHQSMSRKGNCLDNAIMENFFGILKSELFYLKKFRSVKEFKVELKQYIEYYNNRRIKQRLNGLSPVDYRLQFAP